MRKRVLSVVLSLTILTSLSQMNFQNKVYAASDYQESAVETDVDLLPEKTEDMGQVADEPAEDAGTFEVDDSQTNTSDVNDPAENSSEEATAVDAADETVTDKNSSENSNSEDAASESEAASETNTEDSASKASAEEAPSQAAADSSISDELKKDDEAESASDESELEVSVRNAADDNPEWYKDFGYAFDDYNSVLMLWDYHGNDSDVVVPAYAEKDGKRYPTSIGGYIFERCEQVTSVTFEEGCKATGLCNLFYGCKNLTGVEFNGLDTSEVVDMRQLFDDCRNLEEINLNELSDTSNVQYMHGVFQGCYKLKKITMDKISTASAKEMSFMFNGCSSLEELSLSNFNTSNVETMDQMFGGCNKLKSLDLSGFDTSEVKDMSCMFSGCFLLQSLNIGSFDTSNVTNMRDMFGNCESLESIDLSSFDTSSVTDMDCMFCGCKSVKSLNVKHFNTSNVTDMQDMFGGCTSLTTLDLNGFNTSNVTDISAMFKNCEAVTSIDLSTFDTGKVVDMNEMFYRCKALSSLNLKKFNTSNVKNMDWMFDECSSLTTLDVSGFNMSNVTSMGGMFRGCSGLKSLDLSKFKTSKVTDMAQLFNGCSGLTELKIDELDTSAVTTMWGMFEGCTSLAAIDLSGFDTANVTSMGYMFSGCSGLEAIDLTSFDTSGVINMECMFSGCHKLKYLDLSGFSILENCNLKYLIYGEEIEAIYLPESWKYEYYALSSVYNTVIYYPLTTAEWKALGYELGDTVTIICSDTDSLQDPESQEPVYDPVLRIKKFTAPSSNYSKSVELGIVLYTFKIEEFQKSAKIDCEVTAGASWNLYSDASFSDEAIIKDHIVQLDTSKKDHYFYILVTRDEQNIVCKLNLMYNHVTALHYMRESSFTFPNWSLKKLLNSSDIPQKDLAQICLILSAKSENGSNTNSSNALDEDLLELGLVDQVNDYNRTHYMYGIYNPSVAAHTFALTKYKQGKNTYNIITVVCRGTTPGDGDMTLDALPDGFLLSASNIYNDLKAFLKARGINSINDSNNRYLLTGHSLGGASVNLLQYLLMAEGGCYANDITCYTYASPLTTWSYDNSPTTYGFTMNFLRYEDAVPMTNNSYGNMLQSALRNKFNQSAIGNLAAYLQLYEKKNYKAMRYGRDYYLGHTSDRMKYYYNQLTGDSYGNGDIRPLKRHVCETYMACLLADFDSGMFASNVSWAKKHRLCCIYCPVDVYVTDPDSGVVIASVVNNKIVAEGNEDVSALALGDSKFVILSGEKEYDLKLVGNDTGEMEIRFQEEQYDGNNISFENSRVIENIELETDKNFITTVGCEVEPYDYELSITDSNGKIVATVTDDGKEEPVEPGTGGDDPGTGEEPAIGDDPEAGGQDTDNGKTDQNHTAGEQKASVENKIALTGISLSYSKLTLGKGGSFKLEATPAPQNADMQALNWLSSDSKIATVSNDGLIKAKKKGTCTITVTTADGKLSAKCDLTVKKDPVKIKKATLDKKKLTMTVGSTYSLVSGFKPFNATIKSTTFKSDNKKVAAVSKNGVVTAKKKGTCTITVTIKDKAGKSKTAKCKVTVK
ncbi:BspA family leucine-rich repeat surface protein [Butyrivibrio sp. WCD3002]|uniref:BspA family leucine-rich repeat surface protein n=1 Tax=Butyrivibrio sp. WCD3002 TaxID=1280676 RepID=UPI000427D32E|nr:BspA family leucine-rich repeat surface protein [Butyrivibrio sp. WCD3002]